VASAARPAPAQITNVSAAPVRESARNFTMGLLGIKANPATATTVLREPEVTMKAF
jgi:hypothetical protein